MHDCSFGARYARLDDATDASYLDYLDELAALPAVQGAKRAATTALALQPGHRVLEVGCGTGVDLLHLAQAVRPRGSVVGVDASARALGVARARITDWPEVEFTCARAEDLPYEDATFDACRADRTLQHVPEPEEALREIRRVMRPGARLAVLEMTSELRGAASDPAVRDAIDRRMWSATARPAWLPLLLPLLLTRSGFASIEVHNTEAESRSLAEADVALRLRASVTEAIVAGTLQQPEAAAWLESLTVAEQQGTLTLLMRFSRITAVAV